MVHSLLQIMHHSKITLIWKTPPLPFHQIRIARKFVPLKLHTPNVLQMPIRYRSSPPIRRNAGKEHLYMEHYDRSVSKSGDSDSSLALLRLMPSPNAFSWNMVISAYAKSGEFDIAHELLHELPMPNVFTWNSMIQSYMVRGRIEQARMCFDEMRGSRDSTSWNTMTVGYTDHGLFSEAIELIKELILETVVLDTFILTTIVNICSDMGLIDLGMQVHSYVCVRGLEIDRVLRSALVNMYSKCGELEVARCLFEGSTEKDEYSVSAMINGYAKCHKLDYARMIFEEHISMKTMSWNTMISAYGNNGFRKEVISLFNEMRRMGINPDAKTYAAALSSNSERIEIEVVDQFHVLARKDGIIHDMVLSSSLIDMYSKFGMLDEARKIFEELEVRDTVVLNTMLTSYCNCGRIKDARELFDAIPVKSNISWNAMIVGYNKNGFVTEALILFHEARSMNVNLDDVSFASMISMAANLCILSLGKQLFACAVNAGLDNDPFVGSAMIDFYCKCGCISDAERLFDQIPELDIVVWNSMLLGYAQNGYGREALEMFEDMRNSGITPNVVTFMGVLCACNHCGLVTKAQHWFRVMEEEYGIVPVFEHYSCMVDLLSRGGCLHEAVDFIERMPFRANMSMWLSVLSGCRAHGDDYIGRMAAERILKLDVMSSSSFVGLANMNAASGHWEKSERIRSVMCAKGVSKNPGSSWMTE